MHSFVLTGHFRSKPTFDRQHRWAAPRPLELELGQREAPVQATLALRLHGIQRRFDDKRFEAAVRLAALKGGGSDHEVVHLALLPGCKVEVMVLGEREGDTCHELAWCLKFDEGGTHKERGGERG